MAAGSDQGTELEKCSMLQSTQILLQAAEKKSLYINGTCMHVRNVLSSQFHQHIEN